jgi:peptidoglycan hydrolase-like protein with peptidoglycan-binding domain
MRRGGLVLLAVLALAHARSATAADPEVAGLQVALASQRLYAGAIDGLAGAATTSAVRSLQRQAGLPVTGRADPSTRAALGALGRPLYGERTIKRGMTGLDVAVLQFLLAVHGQDVGTLDGRFGPRTRAAVVAFQRRARLVPDGVAGAATRAALCPAAGCGHVPTPRRRREYVVRSGDTLTAIAAGQGTTVAALAAANGLDPGGILPAGARLHLPGALLEAAWPQEAVSRATVRAEVDRVAARASVEPRLARAVAWVESGYQANVRSSTGDWGPMQVSPPAWDFVESSLVRGPVPHTAYGNIRVGILYLRRLLDEFGGNERLAVAAYHQGAASVRRYGLLAETQAYVGTVEAIAAS